MIQIEKHTIKVNDVRELEEGKKLSGGEETIIYNQRGKVKTIQTSNSKIYGQEYWMDKYKQHKNILTAEMGTLITGDRFYMWKSIARRLK